MKISSRIMDMRAFLPVKYIGIIIINVLVSSVLHREKLTLILNKIFIIDFSKNGYHFWVL